jgi:hypothetical protein
MKNTDYVTIGLRYGMTHQGRVGKAGIILLDDPGALAEGTMVAIRPIKAGAKTKRPRTQNRRAILKFAGKAKGLPRDASRNIDHYLYGHPKR